MFTRLKISLSRGAVVLAASALLLPFGVAHAIGTTQFTDPNPENGDFFGYSLSITQDGMLAVVGSPDSTIGGTSLEGTAYVFMMNGDGSWTQVAQLAPSDGQQYDRFGGSVSITPDGSKIMVGAFYAPTSGVTSTQGGKAYIYDKPAGGWSGNQTETAELTASNAQPNDNFGASVGLSSDGSTAVVGSKFHDNGAGTQSGEAYVYTEPAGGWTNTTEAAQLAPSAGTANANDNFGISTAISSDGSMVFVGSPRAINSGAVSGRVYEYTEPDTGWTNATETTNITNSDPGNSDGFGSAISLTSDGQTVAIGAPGKVIGGNLSVGTAYIFNKDSNSWGQTAELQGPDSVQFDEYGFSVALSNDGNSLLIGSPNHASDGNVDDGEAYQYNPDGNGGWVQNGSPLKPTTPGTHQDFGYSVFALNNQTDGNAYIGAPALSTPPSGGAQHLNGGSGSHGKAFQFNLAPNATSTNPTSAAWGKKVTISGSDFKPLVSVSFNGVTSPATVNSAGTQITTTVPNGATTGPITITTKNGTGTIPFTVILPPAPTISSLKSNPADEGDQLQIKGSNLVAAQVSLNGQNLTVTKDSKSSVMVNLPANAVSGTLTVTTPSGTASSSLTIAAPSVKAIPKSASHGATITIKGSGLAGVTQVQFNGANTVPTSATDKQITVVVPAGATSGTITVVSPSGQGTSATNLTVL